MGKSEPYRIEIKRSAAKEIEAIPDLATRQSIIQRIGQLATDPRPRGVRKLSARTSYRIRQGRYRIVYTINDAVLIVTVVKVGHRKDVYRR